MIAFGSNWPLEPWQPRRRMKTKPRGNDVVCILDLRLAALLRRGVGLEFGYRMNDEDSCREEWVS